jgi:hypothetical protein
MRDFGGKAQRLQHRRNIRQHGEINYMRGYR